MVYQCKRCGYESIRISDLKSHLQRKNECKDILNCNIMSTQLLEELIKHKLGLNFACNSCDKKFKTMRGKNKHIQSCHKEDKNGSDVRSNTKIINNNITNNITINNNNITIVLNDFGDEDISYIKDDKLFLDKCMKQLSSGISALIEKIYFDKENPQNHNIKMKNFKLNQVMVMTNGEWKQKHTSDTIPKMVSKGQNILNKHYFTDDEYKDKIDERIENEDIDPKSIFLQDLLIPTTKIHTNAISSIKSVISNHNYKKR
jgi:predicted house-cleaning noncanonical NTP pyrophosphatase (MazG superfamily)